MVFVSGFVHQLLSVYLYNSLYARSFSFFFNTLLVSISIYGCSIHLFVFYQNINHCIYVIIVLLIFCAFSVLLSNTASLFV